MIDSARPASAWARDTNLVPLADALKLYIARFGDGPVRAFQSPARVNLRGMHVDTHGGYLNLLAIPRYTVVVVGETGEDTCTVISSHDPNVEYSGPASVPPTTPSTGWRAYIEGVLDQVRRMNYVRPIGFNAAVASDIPMGGGLSSSSSLCTAMLKGVSALWGAEASREDQALAVQASEWHAGARIGLSDQSAMLIAQPDAFINIAIDPLAPSLDGTAIPWSDEVALVIAHSGTSRALSGSERVAYARNRFAYSAAMHLVRHAMERLEYPTPFIEDTHLFSDMTVPRFQPYGGEDAIVEILNTIPPSGTLSELVAMAGEGLMENYNSYFGDLPIADQPKEFSLRGPLIYGISESERARVLGDAFASRSWDEVGAILSAGHDGDRVTARDGSIHMRSARATSPLTHCSGNYGASTAILDLLVDIALDAGAYGATLTGAGMGGAIIALFPAERCDIGIERLLSAINSDVFQTRLDPNAQTTPAQVFRVRPVTAAGELCG